ncbi:hypothetical protein ABI59_02835 [Acidobacteria bacterium Mor1]|nr:hypothetical protein ABI59_02835 [Acidobacteria bacterium Mor1]
MLEALDRAQTDRDRLLEEVEALRAKLDSLEQTAAHRFPVPLDGVTEVLRSAIDELRTEPPHAESGS